MTRPNNGAIVSLPRTTNASLRTGHREVEYRAGLGSIGSAVSSNERRGPSNMSYRHVMVSEPGQAQRGLLQTLVGQPRRLACGGAFARAR